MTTAYTSLIGLALPVTGELNGTWGDTVNNYISTYVDAAVAGAQTISGTQTAVTLTVTNGSSLSQAGGAGTTGSAQYQIINCTGNPSGLLTITAPASSRQYIIINATSTSQSVKIVGAGPTTGVTLIAGEKAHVAWNGTDYVKVATTAAAGGSNTQVQYNNNGVLAGSSSFVFDGTNVGLGVTPSAWSTGNALQIGSTTAALNDGSGNTYWGNNFYYNSGFKYLTTAGSVSYVQAGSEHRWNVAPSGTAGDPITFTQAMTLDASGRLLVGQTSGTSGQLIIGSNGATQSAIGFVDTQGAGRTFVTGPGVGTGTVGDFGFYDLTASQLAFLYTGGASGKWAWYTNGTERARIDSSGNFLLGTTYNPNGYRAIISGDVGLYTTDDTTGTVILRLGSSTSMPQGIAAVAGVKTAAGTGYMTLNTAYGGTLNEVARIDSSGNLLVGTTTNTGGYRQAVFAGNNANIAQFDCTPANGGFIALSSSGTVKGYFGIGANTITGATINDVGITASGSLIFGSISGGTERARIDSSGNLLVGQTAGDQTVQGIILNSYGTGRFITNGGADNVCLYLNRIASDGAIQKFLRNSSEVGSVSVTTSATAYNTSSDYRLKDNQQPLTGSGAFIDALQPKTWNWKADGSKGVGFIAHEVQEVSPNSVVGEKDAVDEDGKPKYQAMEYGSAEFIANIVAELQSLRARVAALEAKG